MVTHTSVIASFDTRGNMIPVAFRYGSLRLRVDRICWHMKDTARKVVTFCCMVMSGDRRMEVMMYFHQMPCTWYVDLRSG